jgi:hypothetical protein
MAKSVVFDLAMERLASHNGKTMRISYSFNPNSEPVCVMTECILAHDECKSVMAQSPELMKKLRERLEGIPQKDLSCREVITKTIESEIFHIFIGISKYVRKFSIEGFACSMASEVSKLMDIAHIISDKHLLLLFCTLSCVQFADIDAKVSRIDTSKISDGVIKFFYEEPLSHHELFREVTITNLRDSKERKVVSKLVFPEFKEAEFEF